MLLTALLLLLTCRLATFYSRSRSERWCKGETSGNFIKVTQVFHDCDRDSIIYLGDPIGPTCHTGARCGSCADICCLKLVLLAYCDRGSIIYLRDPIGPTCHTGARCGSCFAIECTVL